MYPNPRIDDSRIPVPPAAVGWIAVRLAAIGMAAQAGGLVVQHGALPTGIVVANVVPVALFLAAYYALPAVRAGVMALDLRLITMLQSARVVGASFLFLYAFDVLPGLFAWPAGVGDVVMGVTAPFVAFALIRRPNWAGSRGFFAWNLFGLADFAVALTVGAIASGRLAALPMDGATSAAMMESVLAFIPGFLVPLFIILHIIALIQSAQVRRQARNAS